MWGQDGYEVFASYRPPGAFGAPEKVADGYIGVAVDANDVGDAVLTFTRYGYQEGYRQLYTSFRPAGGTWGPPEAVSDRIPDLMNDWGSDVALTPEGRAIFLWEGPETEGGKSVVKTASRLRGGNVGDVSTLSAPDADAHLPEVATDAIGNAVAVWTQSSSP